MGLNDQFPTHYLFPIESSSLILNQAENLARQQLQNLAQAVDFSAKMKVAFGDNADATELQLAWKAEDLSALPKIEVRSRSDINGANGAYAADVNTIYISQEFLKQNAANVEAIASVILEEIGHAIDSHLNALDTPGDEGEIFAYLAQGIELNECDIQRLKAEDDRVTVNIDGNNLQIEQATSLFLTNLQSATGVLVDSQSNVLVSQNWVNPQTFQAQTLIAKYTPNGQRIGANIFGVNQIKIAAAPSLGGAIGLQSDGLVFSLDTNTLTGYALFNIRQLQVDISAVYDYTINQVYKPAIGIFPQYATYNDIAVRQNGSVTELFVTGQSSGSTGILPFIMRIRIENNTITEAKVLIDGARQQFGGAISVPAPGIAVNPQGNVITTLPSGGGAYTAMHLVTFPADFNPNDIAQLQEITPLIEGIDSFGMTSDTQGNFYILANAYQYPAQAILLTIPPTLDKYHVETLGSPGFDGLPRGDVAIDSASQKAYVTFSNSVIAVTGVVPPPPFIINGTSGNDNLTGTSGNDLIDGKAGNDTLNGGTGSDRLIGGTGNDTYIIDNSGDAIVENLNEGIDTVQSAISYTLGANLENLILTGTAAINGTGNSLNNTLIGNSGNNTLTGGAGNDTLNGGAGNDSMTGGTGNDTYIVDSLGDIITENLNEGIDTVQSAISYTLGANLENLILTGTAAINGTGNSLNNSLTGNSGNNTLTSGAGNDSIDGGAGNDQLVGGDGNDTLVGRAGNDTLTGGNGQDFFTFSSPNDKVDTITDFNPTDDTIRVDDVGFAGGLVAGTLLGAQFVLGTTAKDGSDHFIYNQSTGALFFDVDGTGTGAQVQIATLTTKPVIGFANIIVI